MFCFSGEGAREVSDVGEQFERRRIHAVNATYGSGVDSSRSRTSAGVCQLWRSRGRLLSRAAM
jgi:hypothetical protein